MTPIETVEHALAAETDKCILWPHAVDRQGYGRIQRGGRNRRVSGFILERVSGPRPDGQLALHGPCHNRLCINHRHLHWGTRRENQEDRLRDGTWGNKLDAKTALIIREQACWESQYVVAERFGVSQSTVSRIANGALWGILT